MFDSKDDRHSGAVDTIRVPLSEALTKIRTIRRHTLDVAAEGLDMTPRRLHNIETGRTHPDASTIARMADFYGLDADRLGTERMIHPSVPSVDPAACIIWFGWLPIAYQSNEAPNERILQSVADGIRLLRSIGTNGPVPMRDSELDLVMTLLDLDDDELVLDAVRAFRLPWKQTDELIAGATVRVRSQSLVRDAQGLLRLATDGDRAVEG